MALSAGARFGRYDVTALLGTGGMGEVYLATDSGLNRDVAIKVLPAAVGTDPDRLARFEREARLLAALNHPNVAHVYGLERNGDTTGLVMELVAGQTLAERLVAGPLPPDEALAIARQIADALEAAHARGIVHRDLKPANIKLAADGSVKVLDFGIAKALESRETLVASQPGVTRTGMVIGTPGYMSPEQAAGRPIDERTDIWSFGCVLYELLTGRRAFVADDPVFAPPVDTSGLPAHARLTVELCLRPDPKRRLADIRDVKLALDGALETTAPGGGAARVAPGRGRAALLAAAGLATGGGILALAWLGTPVQSIAPVTRFATSVELALPEVSIADDGSRIAYWSGTPLQIHVRALDEFEGRAVPGTTDTSTPPPPPPCFSPDGRWLAYSADGYTRLKKIPLEGGTALPLAEGLETADFCDWGEDGHIYFGSSKGIERVAELGGRAELIAAPAGERNELSYEVPTLLPGNARVLFTIVASGSRRIAVVDLATREVRTLLDEAGFASFAATSANRRRGHLLYGRSGALIAAPFDLATLEVGTASPVAEGIAETGPFTYAVTSRSGTLAYISGGGYGSGDAALTWVDRAGGEQALPQAPALLGEVALAPDGRRAAISITDPETFDTDLWLYEIDGDRLSRLTFDEPGASGVRVNLGATWTPDGQRLVYFHQDQVTMIGSGNSELRSLPADGSGPPIVLAPSAAWPPRRLETTALTRDGRTLLGTARNSDVARGDIWLLPLPNGVAAPAAADSAARNFLASGANERHATLSPDGRFVAYTSDETGRDEVYVVPFPDAGGKFQVSNDGGTLPRWNPSGGELFYLSQGRMTAVEVDTSAAFRKSAARVLFDAPALVVTLGWPYDVIPDGSRFLMLKAARGALQPMELNVVVNWFEEVRRLAPAAP